jgi:hypothetical protein
MKDSIAQHSSKRHLPSETQERLLKLLAAAEGPLRSSELEQRAGLFTGELRGACNWLWDNGYVARSIKKVRVQAGRAASLKRLAFWSLSDKGREHLTVGVERRSG